MKLIKTFLAELMNRLPHFITQFIGWYDGLTRSLMKPISFFYLVFFLEKTVFDFLVFCSLLRDAAQILLMKLLLDVLFVKGTLMQIWKTASIFVFILKILCWRFQIKTLFNFWDMRTWNMWKVCLQTFRKNRISLLFKKFTNFTGK